ncbi:MAG: signal recognition particle receptor subunit alpha, partial [Treponema sp.]|nr:signal recognition particle receptor subunit alpha [Treponema sp.]
MNFAARIKNFFSSNAGLPEDFFDKLGDLLIEGDFGAAPAMKIVERLEHIVKKAGINEPAHIKEQLIQLLTDGLLEICPDRQVENIPETITVILLLGVNGTGKTTTAAKLASRYKSMGKKPILAAADTFRAGAIDQLKIHGEKIKVRVVAHQQGGDPAAVVYDAVETSMAGAGVGGGDLIIVDTAGRMHTKTALVEELKKIYRVLENKSNETGTI